MKLQTSFLAMQLIPVAPPVGAWIETVITGEDIVTYNVAPPVGAWIETSSVVTPEITTPSRAPRGRVD